MLGGFLKNSLCSEVILAFVTLRWFNIGAIGPSVVCIWWCWIQWIWYIIQEV